MGLPKIIQIPCHNVLANQNALKFKKGAPLEQFFNINFVIGIIKTCSYFWHISLCFYSNFDQERSLDAEWNSAFNELPWLNLSKNTGGYVENMNKKSSFFFYDTYSQIYIKNCLRSAPFFNFKEFSLANTWWHGICIIFGRPILNWNFL